MNIASVVFGVILAILFIVGLSTPDTSAGWLTWFDGIGAVCAFGVSASIGNDRPRNVNFGATMAMAIGLGVLWIVGLSTNGAPYQNWWTFVTAVGFLVESIYAYNQGAPSQRIPTTGAESDRFKRAG